MLRNVTIYSKVYFSCYNNLAIPLWDPTGVDKPTGHKRRQTSTEVDFRSYLSSSALYELHCLLQDFTWMTKLALTSKTYRLVKPGNTTVHG